jgi:hypothetical protein
MPGARARRFRRASPGMVFAFEPMTPAELREINRWRRSRAPIARAATTRQGPWLLAGAPRVVDRLGFGGALW